MDVLAPVVDEGRGRLRKAPGSRQTGFDPGIPELVASESSLRHRIRRTTEGIDTSQYLQERKETSTSLVVASEKESAQTGRVPSLVALRVRGSGSDNGRARDLPQAKVKPS